MSLSEISIGHPSILNQLNTYLRNRHFPNAMLFFGRKGSGKSFFARQWIEDLLCQSPDLGKACGQCKSCILSRTDHHPDKLVIEPDDKQSIKIETIRDMQAFYSLKPVYAEKKWILIEDAHQLTLEASQALLKNLEEPNDSSRFILTTHHLEGLLPTIRSRCSLIPFHGYSEEEIKQLLRKKSEDTILIQEIAIIAKGNVKLAFQLLDPVFREEYEKLISLFFEVGDHLYEKLPMKAKDDLIQLLHCWEDTLLDLIKYGLSKQSALFKNGAWLVKKFQPTAAVRIEKMLNLQKQLVQYEKNLQSANPYMTSFTHCLLADIYHAFH